MPAMPPQSSLSTIISADGRVRYRITRDDVLWMARMAKFEGSVESAPALLWALTQRMAWASRKKFPTLTSLAQAFSQPINPIWSRTGSMCRPGGRYAGKSDCSPTALARRDRALATGWNDIDPALTDIVARWAQGKVPHPVPTAANWGSLTAREGYSRSKAESYLLDNPGSVIVARYGGNGFIAEVDTKNWPDDHVTLTNRDGSVTATTYTKAPFLMALARGIGRGLSLV